jgi:hypothetical protein
MHLMMNKMKILPFLMLALASGRAVESRAADNIILHHTLSWKEKLELSVTETEKVQSLYFDGAAYNDKHLPIFYESVPLDGNPQSFTAAIENAVFEPLKETTLIDASVVKAEPVVTSETGYSKKRPIARITIFPFRKNVAGVIEKLVSFDLKITPSVSLRAPSRPARTFSTSSVLATGDWYKIGTTKDGIHKISYQFLKSLGLDIDHIDPRSIRLYGNGSGMLPYVAGAPRYDDLQENAIYISGENDGKFDASDYLLFYGQAQVKWTYNSATGLYSHALNEFSDTTYYFITTGGTGKRINSRASASSSNQTITAYDDHYYHEADLANYLKSGRKWYGEAFDISSGATWTVSDLLLVTSDTVKVAVSAISHTLLPYNGDLTLKLNGSTVGSTSVLYTSIGVSYDYAKPGFISGNSFSSSTTMEVAVSLSSLDVSGNGALDYFELSCRNNLSFLSSAPAQFQFRDSRTVGAGNIGQFIVNNAPSSVRIWDVTDPINIEEQQFAFSSGQASFNYPADMLREYVAFTGNYYSPVAFGRVANQNLHGLPQAQYLIVTNPAFLSQANQLADFHRSHDGITVHVVTTEQIFNEFSSGSQDVSAIRDFAKMFYDRATGPSDMPKYMLLFGDASYDNKHRISGNTDFVTSYQSLSSLNLTTSYISDDFFGFLDDTEGDWEATSNQVLDIAMGRLPVKTPTEAKAVLSKIISYASSDRLTTEETCCNTTSSVFGDWRNSITFVADDQDLNAHFIQADSLARMTGNQHLVYNIDKIYLDAYHEESVPGGQRFPEARDAIVQKVERGTLLMTWIGHGGEVGWAHERVLDVTDINGWTNSKKLAAFFTATCEFTRVDDPSRTSAGELVVLNPDGGGICLFSTSRLAYAGSNFSLGNRFFAHFLTPVNGAMPTCGEIFEKTKIDYTDPYTRNFLLIGDPALTLAYPKFDVVTTSINAHPISSVSDTLSALSKVIITGEVRDKAGNKLTNFNGIVYPTVYDKAVTYHTLGNDAGSSDSDSSAPFLLQKNILYKGKATVTNGDFTFQFIVPKDIAYQYGYGKLSYYAQNGETDANGYYANVMIGGVNTNATTDNTGPEIKLYMNDNKFVFGGMTDTDPYLYAELKDENGINTVGNGIGHDVTSILDDDNSKLAVLNDYYEADIDDYRTGKVRYQLHDLSVGRHQLTLKVWDVYNNSREARTEFIVAETAQLALDHVLNYPNPFTTHTTFMFEHNHACSQLQAQVQIFTSSGRLVKTLEKLIDTEGYRSTEIEWNGLDDYGDRIGRGVYVYKVRIKTNDGKYAEKFEKLVILR